ncbi:hypothetical protein M9H77_20919 [Catharanthus roseus]|uniref:Uncharacterized protein n=1 Tax=Catharanthus roseus TaxID=4058 RepID=A0ACC0ALX5_CATRO|nr:hypothetical protein M9H77_20919 [Catharanthus roseus]
MSISHLVTNNLEISALNIIQEVQVLFQMGCTYKQAWYARKFSIERVFGSWETTFNILPKYLQAVQDNNSRIVYEFLHHRTSSPRNNVFKFVFWCFSPYIDGFAYCRPLISVDGTHLRGPYKGVLLIAIHRFCLHHIRANFNKTFKNTNLKTLMWQAGTESKQWKFDRVMKDIQERNIDAYIYLMKHGIMTTNISEALNSVLKKDRVLPLKALVELIFNKLVKYFHQHREEAKNCVHPFPT